MLYCPGPRCCITTNLRSCAFPEGPRTSTSAKKQCGCSCWRLCRISQDQGWQSPVLGKKTPSYRFQSWTLFSCFCWRWISYFGCRRRAEALLLGWWGPVYCQIRTRWLGWWRVLSWRCRTISGTWISRVLRGLPRLFEPFAFGERIEVFGYWSVDWRLEYFFIRVSHLGINLFKITSNPPNPHCALKILPAKVHGRSAEWWLGGVPRWKRRYRFEMN